MGKMAKMDLMERMARMVQTEVPVQQVLLTILILIHNMTKSLC